MCLVSDQETGHTSFQTGPVNQEFEKHCNVKYAQRGSRLVYCTSIAVFPAGQFVLYTLLPFFPLVGLYCRRFFCWSAQVLDMAATRRSARIAVS